MINKDWWKNFFDERYLKTYVDIKSKEATLKEVKFLFGVIKNKFKDQKIKILDLACGYGRHSILLAQKGLKVVGVDYSKYFLKIALAKVKDLGFKNVKFIRKDVRKISYQNEFDLVINMFTSFGYFRDEKDNIKVLKNVYRALKKGGYFILDLENAVCLVNTLIKRGKTDKDGFLFIENKKLLSNNLEVLTKLAFNHLNLRFVLERKWRENNKKNSSKANCRLYYPEEILSYLRLLNFKIVKIYGDFRKNKYTFDSPRMIIIAQK